ncbi:MAG: hypothetical protein RSG77_21705 [Hafnia sp.]
MIRQFLIHSDNDFQHTEEMETLHNEMCKFYVAAIRYLDNANVAHHKHEEDYQSVYLNTKRLTANISNVIKPPDNQKPLSDGKIVKFPRKPDYEGMAYDFFIYFHELAMEALRKYTPVAGYQVLDKEGRPFGNYNSNIILSEDDAINGLEVARNYSPESNWQMVAILEGEIKNPQFVGSRRKT